MDTNSKARRLRRTVSCGRETSKHTGKESLQVALPAGSSTQTGQQQRGPGSQKVSKLLGQMSDANESNLPVGTLVKQPKEEPQWPQTDAAGIGDTTQARMMPPPSAVPTCHYFYPSGFPEPHTVSVIPPPSMELLQLLILFPLKAVNSLQPNQRVPKVYCQLSEVLNMN